MAAFHSNAAPQPLLDALAAHKLKRTPVRIGVLSLLAKRDVPADVATIVAGLPGAVDAVTVYRTLNTFVSKKIVHRVRGEDRSWRYALGDGSRRAAHHHAHFVCDDCGTVECINEAQLSAKALAKLAPAEGYVVDYPEVTLHGTCPKCQ